MNSPKQYLTEREVSQMTRIALQTLRNDRVKGKGIPWIKLGSSKRASVRYALEDVLGYMDSHKVTPPKI